MIARSATTSTNARDITSKCFKIFTQNIHIDPLFFISRCQQECVNTIGSYKCECFPGFRFNSFDQCIDIDECKMENFRCPSAAQCFNTAGSYKCICTDGFKLSRDKSECIEIKNECKPLLVKNGEARCTRSR